MRTPTTREFSARPSEDGTGSRKRGRPTGDHEAKSREFIEAARHVIAHYGYTAASLKRVAEHLGRTTGSVTYYFASKEDMIKQVAISLFDEYDQLFQENSEETDLQSIFDSFILWEKPEKRGTWLVWFHLLPHAATDPALASIFRQRNGRLRAKLAALVAKCQQQGSIRSDFSAELLADQITAMTDGWIMMTPVEPSRFKPARIKELVKLSIAMLAPPGKAKASNRK